MARVALKNLCKRYTADMVVKDVTLEIGDKELFVLVGPSGCGKSTTLRMIGGLEDITSGDILIDDKIVNNVSPKDRNIAMVFQNYALYPHMSVHQNMGFGLSLRGYSQKEIDTRVREAATFLNIAELLDRNPRTLSGGQRQRVAVGRAIVRKPKVFLFDEPLSDLDAKLRVNMRTELVHLQRRLQTTMIYVTHDQIEAMTMGDRIAVMKAGTIQQIARPLELYESPANRFVAEFIGQPTMNFFNTTVLVRDNRLWLDQGHFQLQLPARVRPGAPLQAGQRVVMGIRAQHIHDRLFQPGDGDEGNRVLAMVDLLEPIGSETYLHLTAGGVRFVARIDSYNPVQINQPIEMSFSMEKVLLFKPDESGARIDI